MIESENQQHTEDYPKPLDIDEGYKKGYIFITSLKPAIFFRPA